MPRFQIVPYIGASPLMFGMSRAAVHLQLGGPKVAGENSDSWGEKLEINVGYDRENLVNHIGFSPGDVALHFGDAIIWKPNIDSDPIPTLLAVDGNPLERLGFLVFNKIGIATTGYHDDDPSQHAVSLFPKGAWESKLAKAKHPDLSRYNST